MFTSVEDIPEGRPIYVKAVSSPTMEAGDIILTVYRRDGKPSAIIVPKTHIPIRITDFAPADMIKDSTDFRRVIASGILAIIPEKEAIEELSTPEGMEELERLRKEIFKGMSVEKGVETTPIDVISRLDDKVSIKVKDIMMRSDIQDQERLRLLRIEQSSLGIDDYKFILSLVDENSEIGKWTRKQMEA